MNNNISWVLIVVRDNTVEYCHSFSDYFEGEARANETIKNIGFITSDFPKYRQNERYYDEEIIILLESKLRSLFTLH